AGRHDLTERWVRWVRSTKYRLAPNGLDGNDDCGTLSAWYVWSALGIYPVAGTARYEIGTPLFERAVIKRSAGDLVIEADAPGRATGRALMDEVAIKGWSLNHDQLRAGGTLRFEERSKLRRP
ncbi:MAG: glycoside hydrolase domain-containing protein, partial [Planctomycetota bacterium]